MTEALGMALVGHGTIPAIDSRRLQLARKAGEQIMELMTSDIRPRDIINKDSILNAFTVDMALGGSTNSVLHLMAIAHEAGVDFPLSMINQISQRTPHLSKIRPAGEYHLEDLDRAGGIAAVMKELKGLLKVGVKTVSGKTVLGIISESRNMDKEVIRPVAQAYSPSGGIAILFGNLAPEGAVVKRSAEQPGSLTLKKKRPRRLWIRR
jgi:dihydroxy-acid dehydratase